MPLFVRQPRFYLASSRSAERPTTEGDGGTSLLGVGLLGHVSIADRPPQALQQLRSKMLAVESATPTRSLSITLSVVPSAITMIRGIMLSLVLDV